MLERTLIEPEMARTTAVGDALARLRARSIGRPARCHSSLEPDHSTPHHWK